MATTSTPAQPSEKPKSRQRQGPACAECRRRKLRCDGQQPNCGTCSDLGITCEQTTFTTPRGPKKGYMKALQTRMSSLEARLQEQMASAAAPANLPDVGLPEMQLPCDNSDTHLQEQMVSAAAPVNFPDMGLPDMQLPCDTSMFQFNAQLPTPPTTTNRTATFLPQEMSMDMDMEVLQTFGYGIDPEIPELVRADLDQMFFERAHSFAPILQRRRYFSWANQPSKTEAQRGLQYALWTLASTFSTQSEYLRVTLRTAALRILDTLENRDLDPYSIEIEHAQARVILLIHDFLKSSFDLGWLGAATCFRLLQYIRLYEMDSPQQVSKRTAAAQDEDKVHTEELRRTFWVAYTIDCFINLRSERPLTFQETAIIVRLPVPEEQFQYGRLSRQNLLSEAVNLFTDQGYCPFSESIIIATICTRAMLHAQQAAVENVYSRVTSRFWDRHFWIEELLKARSLVLGLHDSESMMDTDGLLIFAKMASHSIMLYLCQILESKTWITPEDQDAVLKVKERTAQAAQELAVLADSVVQLNRFKIHPFSPLLLGFCADFLKDRHGDFGLDNINIQQITQLLSGMRSMSRLADDAYTNASMPALASTSM